VGILKLVRKEELTEAEGSPGMSRAAAFASDDLWIGTATTHGGAVSGWHHHGAHDSYIYVVSGTAVLEDADGGRRLEAHAGDHVHVPKYAVHRESNPEPTPSELLVLRLGTGDVVVNVEGPLR
jgi:uncharacterized RmlC-like cupin family protein